MERGFNAFVFHYLYYVKFYVLRTCGLISVYDFTSKDDFLKYLELVLFEKTKFKNKNNILVY